MVIDPLTGAQTGALLPFVLHPGYAVISPDGTRALTIASQFPGDGTTKVQVLRIT